MAKADPDNQKDVGTDKDADIIAEARERFAYSESVDGDNRKAQAEDTRFVYVAGAQWSEDVRAQRTKWKQPCLEFNQLKQFVHQVVNDQRQGRPGVRIHPASGSASEKVAELKQDLIRGIEYKSNAEAAYDTGFQHAVVGGRGYWRIRSDYESRKSFNQCLVIDRLPDPQAVRMDPDYQAADASDIQWCFVVSPIKKSDYERKFKDHPLSWEPTDQTKGWYIDSETVLIADYYRLVTKDRELCLLEDGSTVWKDERKRGAPKIVSTRMAEDVRCEWYTLGGGEKVLKRNPWRGTFIPVICCMGDEIIVDGKKIYQGLIRQAKQPQQLYNFGMTQQAVTLALTPKAPWVGPVKAVKGYEHIWNTANNEDYSFLPYNDFDEETARPINAPQRQQGSFPDAGWINWSQTMLQQIRSTIGMYESSLGMRSQETSGRAILAREKQGDNATFHYLDNLSRAIAHTGRVLEDLIPHYYDTQRLVSLVSVDGKQRLAPINERVIEVDEQGAVQAVTNPDNDITRGEYAVTVEAGPSYATKREEARATLVELMGMRPEVAALAFDKLMKLVDMPDADDLADRFKAMLPPQIQQMEQAKEQGQDPRMAQMAQQMQAVQQQAQQAIQQLQQQMQQLAQENQALKADRQAQSEATAQKAQQSSEKHDIEQAKVFVEVFKVLTEFVKAQQAAAIPGAVQASVAAGTEVLQASEAV